MSIGQKQVHEKVSKYSFSIFDSEIIYQLSSFKWQFFSYVVLGWELIQGAREWVFILYEIISKICC